MGSSTSKEGTTAATDQSAGVPDRSGDGDGENAFQCDENETVWRHDLTLPEARARYEADGTVPVGCSDEMLELRMYISDPSLLRGLIAFAKGKSSAAGRSIMLLRRWADMMAFKYIGNNSPDLLVSTGYDVYFNYLNPQNAGARRVMCDAGIVEKIEAELMEAATLNNENRKVNSSLGILRSSLFDEIYFPDMEMILSRIYVPFKESPEYDNTVSKFKTQYNQISVQDFEYMEALGHGGFGCVVHCKKKSTGIHYAMKIQTKDGAIKHSHGDFAKVTIEKDALVLCNHPFITNLVYSFQNEQLTMMVMSLAGGSLAELADEFPGSILPEEHVIFYAAEILLALNHVHRLGMIYRDMKPGNVLVMGDGHVKLADLGGVVDVGNVVAGYHTEAEGGIFAAADQGRVGCEVSSSVLNGSHSDGDGSKSKASSSGERLASMAEGGNDKMKNKTRTKYNVAVAPTSTGVRKAYTYFGTAGYVAPEILRTIVKPEDGSARSKEGYTHAVDFFSLGVSMYQLLTAQLPFEFRTNNVERFECSFNYRPFPQKEDGSYTASAECRELLERLLVGEEKTRLGYGRSGFSKIKKHPAFGGLSWILLTHRKMPPPLLPEKLMANMEDGGHLGTDVRQTDKFDGFYHMLMQMGHTTWVTKSAMTTEEQAHFRSWDYVSGDALGLEIKHAQGRVPKKSKVKKKKKKGLFSWFSLLSAASAAPVVPKEDSGHMSYHELEASSYISSCHMVDTAAQLLQTIEADQVLNALHKGPVTLEEEDDVF